MLNILEYYEQNPGKQVALVFIDAQKAFDRVNWEFIITQLEHMGFGQRFINAIKAIYSKQAARLLINGDLTEEFSINKGTRQGCPLSPLLFILQLETLLRKIRNEEKIKGLKIGQHVYKTQAFADDMAFILEEPIESCTYLLKMIEEYGLVAGLRINKKKTNLLTKNIPERGIKELQEVTGLKIVSKTKYLGIWLSGRCSSIQEDNYNKLLIQTKKDLDKWGKIQLSLLGRVTTVKSYILPKFNFLFQTAPVNLSKSFFKELNRLVTKFIWQGKKPRIKRKMMQEVKERGGLGLPNWENYYSAALLVWVKEWITLDNIRLLKLEGYDLQQGWHMALWRNGTPQSKWFTRHYVRNILIRNWEKVSKKYYIKTPCWIVPEEALTYPKLYNPSKKLTYKELLNVQGKLKSKQEISTLGIQIDWWTYLQIQSKFKKDKEGRGIYMELQELDKILMGQEKGMISKSYKLLMELEIGDEIIKDTMIAWGKNFGYSINLEKWQGIWWENMKLVVSTAYKENIYKMIYRWHLPPDRLAKMFIGQSPKCWKCGLEKGTYYHQWWTCPEAGKFWGKIKNWLNEILNQKIEWPPETCLLGSKPDNIKKDLWYLALHIIIAARLIYAQFWKNPNTPPEEAIIKKILDCAEADKLTKKLKDRDQTQTCLSWEKLYIWLEKRKL